MRKLSLAVVLLLASCMDQRRAEAGARAWAAAMRYTVVALDCVVTSPNTTSCVIRAAEAPMPIALKCVDKAAGVRCHMGMDD